MSAKPLPVWDRSGGRLIREFMQDAPQTYETRPTHSPRQWLESQPAFDWLVALYQNSHLSARKIAPFVKNHAIDLSAFKPVGYRSFAEFFGREFREGARPFTRADDEMAAFAEARYFGWEQLVATRRFPIKGHSLSARDILGSDKDARPFLGGPVMLARLAPVDYHHVHYPDDGVTVAHWRLGHRLWTVNWHALRHKGDILFRNERQVNILETDHFGCLAFVEIGALSVGRIVQVHPLETRFARGEEKSAFRFGGSAIIVFGEAGRWRPARDIVERTEDGIETLVRLGEPIATANRSRGEELQRGPEH
jgi:phosphatidylserine decarboxylase